MNFPLEHPLLSLKRYKTVTLMATNLKESLFLRFLFCSFFFFFCLLYMPGESLAGISVIIEKTNLVHCILKSAVLANQKPHEIKLETS